MKFFKCPKCGEKKSTRKPGKGRTPACGACKLERGRGGHDPKHYDANGVRYGTPGRKTLRVCKYCTSEYERQPTDFKEPVCGNCREKHMEIITPKRKEQKSQTPHNDSEYRKKKRISRKLKKAGLPEDWYEQQGDRCGICHTTDPGGKGTWHIDHDHTCCPYPSRGSIVGCANCIRGILCYHCNTGLGHFRDDPIRLSAAIDWVKRYSS